MKKQIKRKLAILGLLGITSIVSNAPINSYANNSILVNQNSIIEEQDTTNNEKQEFFLGWTTTQVNIREKPDTTSKILETVNFNTMILYYLIDSDEEWVKINYQNGVAYIAKKYISKSKCEYQSYEIPNNYGFKSYMSYTAITSPESNQYKLQNLYAYTGDYGIRKVNGRYCIALGTYFNIEIGQYVDLVLENGTVIPCILGDVKANEHTDNNNLFTTANGCCSEFIIDASKLDSKAKRDGNISSCQEIWESSVAYVRIYNRKIFK